MARNILIMLCFILLLPVLAGADIRIDKIKRKSYEMADLVKALMEDREPRMYGKIERDEAGYFIKCGFPEDAIKVFANASTKKITRIVARRYVFAPLSGDAGIVAHLDRNRLYFRKVSDLKAYRQSLMPKPRIVEKPKPVIKSVPEYSPPEVFRVEEEVIEAPVIEREVPAVEYAAETPAEEYAEQEIPGSYGSEEMEITSAGYEMPEEIPEEAPVEYASEITAGEYLEETPETAVDIAEAGYDMEEMGAFGAVEAGGGEEEGYETMEAGEGLPVEEYGEELPAEEYGEELPAEEYGEELPGDELLEEEETPPEEKSESPEITGKYMEAMGKIFEKSPSLSFLIDSKVNGTEITEDMIAGFPDIEQIKKRSKGKEVTDYVFRTGDAAKHAIRFIQECFGTKQKLIQVTEKKYIRPEKAGKNQVAIEVIEK